MRSILSLSAMLLCSLAYGGASSDLLQVRAIYMLPMGSGLDQYLAAQIAKDGHYVIVTDPQRADAIFTDRIGERFERALEQLYPPPEKKEDDTKGSAKQQERVGGLSRIRGAVFLVDRSSRAVLWSNFIPLGSSQPKDVEKRARQIAGDLNKELKNLAKASGAPVPVASPEAIAPPAVKEPAEPNAPVVPQPKPAQPTKP